MLVVVTAAANSQTLPPVNDSHDPYEVYGGCVRNFSGFIAKTGQIAGAAANLRDVTAIDVLECTEFDGGGGDSIVPCPPNSPYAYCVTNHNDGFANHITLGVMKLTQENDPLLSYGGCAPGAGSRLKRALLFEAGRPLWDVDNIVIIDCHAADGAGGTHQVSCPAGRNPYAYCLQNHDDGLGNSLLVGVVNSYSAGDPYGVYGNCYTDTDYRNKASLVTEAGKSLDEVVAIYMLSCGPSFGAPQEVPQIVSCNGISAFPATYSYCLHTSSDGKGNIVTMGVIANPGKSEDHATLTLSTNNLNFGSALVNTASDVRSVTLTNTGTAVLNFNSVGIFGAVSPDGWRTMYATSNSCVSTLAVNASCVIKVRFSPLSAGSVSGTLIIKSNASNGQQNISLSGAGAAPSISLSQNRVEFGNQTVGVSSAVQQVTLTNTDTVSVNISGIWWNGAPAGTFAVSTTCGSILAASGSCGVRMRFDPKATGLVRSVVYITNSATTTPLLIGMAGTGVATPAP
jgi:hypothetical protein